MWLTGSAHRRSRARRAALLVAGLSSGVLPGCQDAAPPRRQLVIVVDTDVPSLDQAYADPELSLAATVDTVRVDLLDGENVIQLFRELTATSALDWPLSFALVPPETGERPVVRLRVRAFRARDASPAVEKGIPTLSPAPEIAIDRVVELAVPPSNVVDRRYLRLAGDCFGRPASFREGTSCVDANRPKVSFSEPLEIAPGDEGSASRRSSVGSWPLARSVPCLAPSAPDRICIPGGVSVVGSALTAGTEDGSVTQSALPMRLVRIDPFAIDTTEMTVGRARRWLDRLSEPPLRRGNARVNESEYCTFDDDPASDRLPLNCVLEVTAKEICALEGGRLPTEAEWNHVATGRGEGRRFPWGDATGTCCTSSSGRSAGNPAKTLRLCEGEGPEPVGSHRGCADGMGLGDVSRDGVLDLGGSVTEIVADRPVALDDPCWGDRFGILHNPRCEKAIQTVSTGGRGGNWNAGISLVVSRISSSLGPDRGFRCAYPDVVR